MVRSSFQSVVFLSFIFLMSLAKSAYPQDYYFDNYSVKEGLAHTKIKSIIQSHDGYVWIGTASGLSRFDGNTFRNYTIEDGISAFGVSALHLDSAETLWIGHLSSGFSYLRKDKFYTIKLDSALGDISDIEQDEKGRLWIATSKSGVYRIDDPFAEKIQISAHITAKSGLPNEVFSMAKTQSLGLLFITGYGVKYYDSKLNKFEFVNDQFIDWPQYFQITSVLEDKNNGFWVGTFNGGLYHYPSVKAKARIFDKRDGLVNNWISDIYQSYDGSVWVATYGGGISVFNGDKIENYDTENGLIDNTITCVAADFEGNMLIGTYSKGLAVFKGRAFIHAKKFLSDRVVQVYGISEGFKNDFWYATNEGLFNATKDQFGHFKTKHFTSDGLNFQSTDVRFVKQDKKGNQWVGTWGGGVSFFDAARNKFTYAYLVNTVLYQASNSANVTAMELDKDGNLWVGSYGGLIYFEPSSDKLNVLTQGSNLLNNDISTLYCDENNMMWVGHRDKGVTQIRISDGTIKPYNFGMEVTPTCILGNESQLWIGTEGMGVFLVNDHKILEHYSFENGLLSNLITALSFDLAGNLFVATNRGLNKIEIKTKRVLSFAEKEGFVGIEIKPNALYRDKTGVLWAGTATGLTQIVPKLLKINELPPITRINRLRVNLEDRPITQDMVFKYNENSILIDYKSICITNADKVAYKVRLIGAEEEWQPITSQTYVNYPSLPPGHYTFEVMAMNNANVWNIESEKFSFTIRPPFWQTIWFYSLVLFVLIIGLVMFIKIRERQLKNEKAELEQKVKERTVEIQQKNDLLAKKNKDITDSINYAQRIQKAIMPPPQKMNELLKSSFIFYRPKDIVSGDFHWNTFYKNKMIVAAADCTGHGVPGAFMSMISISSLNKVVKEKQITDPARILDNMRYDIVADLKQSGDVQAKDGLDIALVAIDIENKIVQFAGAYNPLYIVKAKPVDESQLEYDFAFALFGDRLIEVKADRMPIGISERMDLGFTTKTIQMEKGDQVFVSTDGYIDQFGGANGKKFMSKRFKELLMQLPYSDPENAIVSLEKQFNEWRGEHEQIDDVLVIGICF